jgi:Ca2+-transporting ATPase
MLDSLAEQNWHSITTAQAINSLGSSLHGLSQEEGKRRLSQYGPNELVEQKKVSPWPILLEQFKSFLIIILIIAVALSIAVGEMTEAIVIAVLVLFACGLGFIQEYWAERALQALRKMTVPTSWVIRDNQETPILSKELVLGDLLLISTGDRIMADARLVDTVSLKVDESALTGESVPAEKMTEPVPSESPLGDRRNMVYMGTAVVYGKGMAIVTATGMNTEFGKIASMIQQVEEKQTPLQANLGRIGRWIGIGTLVLCTLLATLGVIRGYEFTEMLLWGVALAVAVVPEALPAVVVITLALGAQRMVKRRALIRKLPAVETLGSATVICSDKTGTLTQGRMVVRQLYVNNRVVHVTGTGYEPEGGFYIDGQVLPPQQDTHLQTLLVIGALCNDAHLTAANEVKGDTTEGALLVAALKAGIYQEELGTRFPRIAEVPFTSERKQMSTIHHSPSGRFAYSKGAPEVVLGHCTYIYSDGQERKLNDKDREDILARVGLMADEGLRVLAMGYKRLNDELDLETMEQDMVFVGLAGITDPPRQEVKQAIASCQQAGIKPVMITGDHRSTAVAIAKQLGLMKGDIAITGAELDSLSDKEFEATVEKIDVYARVSPSHKIRIVDALAKKGHVVAMTGDGVNDAPALKKADIGIAMGITGTEVSKEAADMVLTDDNFASIVAAVEEGRNIVGNIKKYLMYLFSGNLGEVLALSIALLAGTLLGLPSFALPLVAAQILFINLIGDGLAAVALSVDPPDPYIMKRHPLQLREVVFSRPVLGFTIGSALWTGGITLGSFLWAFHSGKSLIEAQCICFVTLLLTRLVHAFNSRSEKYSLFQVGPFANKWLLRAVGLSLLLTMLVIYLPPLQNPFHTFGLSPRDWGVSVGLALTILIVVEAVKFTAAWRGRERATQPG